MAVRTPSPVRQTIKVSEKTAQLLRVLSAIDGSSQTEIADSAIAQYVEQHKKQLSGRLSEIQSLIQKGGDTAVAREFGERVAKRTVR